MPSRGFERINEFEPDAGTIIGITRCEPHRFAECDRGNHRIDGLHAPAEMFAHSTDAAKNSGSLDIERQNAITIYIRLKFRNRCVQKLLSVA